jgi:hypothetical protein
VFLAHFGVGFGTKRLAPATSLGSLFLAAQFIDLLWPSLLLLGIEHVTILRNQSQHPPLLFTHYPYSHSLLMVLVWAALVAFVYRMLRPYTRGAFVLGAAVCSHWLLDWLVHRPDLPLYPGNSPVLGLGLWASLPATIGLELLIFGVGLWLYCRSTEAIDSRGNWGLWGLVLFLLLISGADLAGGDPPPSVNALAWVGQAQWLLVAWGYWVDQHRRARPLQSIQSAHVA